MFLVKPYSISITCPPGAVNVSVVVGAFDSADVTMSVCTLLALNPADVRVEIQVRNLAVADLPPALVANIPSRAHVGSRRPCSTPLVPSPGSRARSRRARSDSGRFCVMRSAARPACACRAPRAASLAAARRARAHGWSAASLFRTHQSQSPENLLDLRFRKKRFAPHAHRAEWQSGGRRVRHQLPREKQAPRAVQWA